MTDIDHRELCGRIHRKQEQIRQRLDQLGAELDAMKNEPPREVLRREREIAREASRMLDQYHALEDRYSMLVAHQWQSRNGFPLIKEMSAR